LDRAIQTAMQWLTDIEAELNWENRDKCYHATKAVLQAIRDRLPVEEVVHFCANLPLIMKGMMLDGYDLKNKPLRIRSEDEFFELVQQYFDASRRDVVDAEEATEAVARVLNRRMGGEMTKAASILPEKIRRLFETAESERLEEQLMA
jgi:uncharacterized protein (DUF2267 family)